MTSLDYVAAFDVDPVEFASSFEREPFGLRHNLSALDLLSIESLERLSHRFRPEDYFVAAGAKTAATAFYSVAHSVYRPHEAIARLDDDNVRVLLKRPENYDPRFRELLLGLFASIAGKHGGTIGRIVRLQSSILISSSATITPFHYDPEVSFFFQIAGPKTYHLYSPSALHETELENFYRRGVVDIAQVDLHGRDPQREYVFELGPGLGMHQPRNSPHWVETRASRSISYVISYETAQMRAVDSTRAMNWYLRKLGAQPGPIGRRPRLDAVKSLAVRMSRPVRGAVKRAVRAKPRG